MPRSPQKIVHRLQRTSHPLVYEVNIRVLLHELSLSLGKPVTLATLPERFIDEWAELGFDAIWLMGVWTGGSLGRQIAIEHPGLQGEFRRVLPDFSEDDVVCSPYAVTAYTVPSALGGWEGLLALRRRLGKRGMGLVLDFVCNHTARDHRWIEQHPEYYIAGQPDDDLQRPGTFFTAKTKKGGRLIAFGKDPYYPGWTDTAQLNYHNAAAREAMLGELRKISGLCDGVRCDMAMLILESIFQQTWGWIAQPDDADPATGEFWKDAIETIREEKKEFLFIAEAYWDMEWELQQLGFDYTYDKRLYDRLLREGAGSVYEHLKAEMNYQQRSVRFIENHDEPRAAQVLYNDAWHCAAATAMSTVPGMILLHEGQLDGRRVKLPVQLVRRPDEPVSLPVRMFYEQLLKVLSDDIFKTGKWQLLGLRPAWHGNELWSNFLAFWWQSKPGSAQLVIINYAPMNSQCYVELPLGTMEGATLEFKDLMSPAVYVRDRQGLLTKGLYFDLQPYGFHIFEVLPLRKI